MSAKELFELFKGLHRAYGQYRTKKTKSHTGKLEGQAVTINDAYAEVLWESHISGTNGLGVIPIQEDNTCWWGAIDIDQYQKFDLDSLYRKIIELKLPLVLCRSKSGGAHCYAFFREAIPAGMVKAKLAEFAVALGYPRVEIFPKQVALTGPKDVGNWINMPYFDAEQTTRYAIKDGKHLSLVEFLEYAHSVKISQADLLALQFTINDEHTDAPPCIQHIYNIGLGSGNRNTGMYSIGVYVKKKYGDDWESYIDKANQDICKPALPSSEIVQLTKSLKRRNYFYKCDELPLNEYCNKDVCRLRKYGVGATGQDLGAFVIGGLTKIETEEPIYILDVDGLNVHCDAPTLLSQAKMRIKIMKVTNKIMPRIKDAIWDKMISEKLANMSIESAPEDAGPMGIFNALLEKYLTQRPAKSLAGVTGGRAYRDAETSKTYFIAHNLFDYLKKNKFYEFTSSEIYSKLRARGIKKIVKNIHRKSYNIWVIDSPEEQSEEFDVPSINDDQPEF